MAERWGPVLFFEGWYEVSDLANVRRIKRGKGTRPGQMIKQTLSLRDRLQVSLSKNGHQRTLPVHVLVAHAFLGPKPPGTEINHIDYDHRNNVPANLEYIAQRDNIRHSYANGHGLTAVRGEASPHAKLTEQAVREIRASTLTRAALALKYGVAEVTIKVARTRRTWKHI